MDGVSLYLGLALRYNSAKQISSGSKLEEFTHQILNSERSNSACEIAGDDLQREWAMRHQAVAISLKNRGYIRVKYTHPLAEFRHLD